MDVNKEIQWITKMSELEDGCDCSVGHLEPYVEEISFLKMCVYLILYIVLHLLNIGLNPIHKLWMFYPIMLIWYGLCRFAESIDNAEKKLIKKLYKHLIH